MPLDGKTAPRHKYAASPQQDAVQDSLSEETASRHKSISPQQDALRDSLLRCSGSNKCRKLVSHQPTAHTKGVKHDCSNGNKRTKRSNTVVKEDKSDEEATGTAGDLDQLDNIGPDTKSVPVPRSSRNGRARRSLKAVRYEKDFAVIDISIDSDEDYDDEPSSDASSKCEDVHNQTSIREEDMPDDARATNHEEDMLDEARPTNHQRRGGRRRRRWNNGRRVCRRGHPHKKLSSQIKAMCKMQEKED